MALGSVSRFSVGFSDAFGYWCSVWGGALSFFIILLQVLWLPPNVGSLGSFLTYAGFCCPCELGRFRGGVGHSEYPSAKLHFNNCLEEWFDKLMVGWLDSVASGDTVQQLFQMFGVHFHGGDSTLIFILMASGISRTLVRLCFGGLCLACVVIGSLVQTWGGQFSFY